MRKLLFISLLLVGCTELETQNSTKTYFDLEGLVNQQITELNKNQPLTHKNLTIEEKKEVDPGIHITEELSENGKSRRRAHPARS